MNYLNGMDWNLITVTIITGLAGLLGAVGGAGVSGHYARKSGRELQIQAVYIEERRDLHIFFEEYMQMSDYPSLDHDALDDRVTSFQARIREKGLTAFSGKIGQHYTDLSRLYTDFASHILRGEVASDTGKLNKAGEAELENIKKLIIEIDVGYKQMILKPKYWKKLAPSK